MTDFFTKIALVLMAVVVVVLMGFSGFLYWNMTSAQKKVDALVTQVSNLEAKNAQQALTNHSQEVAIAQLEKTDKTLSVKLQEQNDIDKEIDNASPEDDAEMAPVLSRALDGVDRLLNGRKD